MSVMPSITGGGRYKDIALIVTLALGQATAAAVAAFSTRDVFAAFRDGRVEMPMLALALIAVAGIAIAALRYRERVVAERVGQHYAAALRVTLFRHLAHISSREIARRRSGGLSLRFVGDLAAVRGWVSLGFARLVSSMIVLPLAAVVLFLLNPHLGLVAAAPFAIGIVLMVIAAPRLGPAHQRLRSRRALLAADMSERAPHAPELRLLGRIQTETRHIEKRTEKLVSAALERARGAALLRAVPDAVSGVAAAAVLYAALSGGASGAEAAGALAAVGLMIQPMRDLAGVWDRHRAWRVAREKCTNLLSVPRLPRGAPDRPQDQDAEQEAAGRELVFKAAAGGGLSPMTIVAAPGRKIAIIGANGAGKSTLLSLAAGLEKPDQGAILLGSRETVTLSTVERRRLITFIGPRSPILAGSLRRALTMGINRGHDDTAVAACAEAFGLGHVIERLGGLSGRIAEAGRNLSAGEIRRVLLTRAALSNASLMLLDEPDDALDRDGPALVERLVFATGATTLLVTHNHALAARLDEVWLMDAGRLVAAGSPETILRECAQRAGAKAA